MRSFVHCQTEAFGRKDFFEAQGILYDTTGLGIGIVGLLGQRSMVYSILSDDLRDL